MGWDRPYLGRSRFSAERRCGGIRPDTDLRYSQTSITTMENQTHSGDGLPRTPCSPSYDAGLLNDFGGGDVGWWQDYIRAEIGRANDYWREIHDQQNALMVRLYNHGYMAGHQDSVASAFVLIHHTDMDSYHADVVAEILQANVRAHAPLPAGAHVDHGVRVVITGDHRNRAAGSGCHVAACSAVFLRSR